MMKQLPRHSSVPSLAWSAAVVCSLIAACGSSGSAPVPTGGQSASGGVAITGGTTSGGSNIGGAVGGGGSTGGSASGGTTAGTPAGGSTTGGTLATGGTIAGGSGGAATGGISSGGATSGGTMAGGTTATGGVRDAGVDTRQNPDTAQTGGIATGGSVATGGVPATGGSGDGCDVGVYDVASPPKVLSLTGNLGTHDPAAIAANGTYYLYATGLAAKTSTNLTTWNGAAAPLATPTWMKEKVSGVDGLWAPDVSFFGGQYHLYYAGSTFGSNKSCIGHATRASLSAGSWTDSGAATVCSNLGSNDNWNAIDPNLVLDAEGTPWLALGSFWGGLKIVQLDSAGNRLGTAVTGIAARPQNGGALEAPFIVRRCGYYYLFMSWDKCCNGASSTYNIRVVRSTSVTGPYTDKAGTPAMQGGGTLIAQGDETWAGPGGQSVMIVGKKAYLVYHAYAKSNGASSLRIADLVWDANGWPVPVGP